MVDSAQGYTFNMAAEIHTDLTIGMRSFQAHLDTLGRILPPQTTLYPLSQVFTTAQRHKGW